MKRKRIVHSAEFKAKVALEAMKEQKTLNELSAEYDVHPVQISNWKKEFRENMSQIFSGPRRTEEQKQKQEEAKLYEEIGRLKMELEWLKKKMQSIP